MTSSTTSTTSSTVPYDVLYTIQGESASLTSDGDLYHFTNMEFDSEDLHHDDGPSSHGIALYTGLTYTPTGYVSMAYNTLVKYDGDSNHTVLGTQLSGSYFNDITYDIINGNIITTTYNQTMNLTFMLGVSLIPDHVVTVPDPVDKKPGTNAFITAITVFEGNLIISTTYTRSDSILVYRLSRIDFSGAELEDYGQTVITSPSNNINSLCMSAGNKGILISLHINKTVSVYDAGPGNPPIVYSISYLPCTNPPSGISTNKLSS